MRRVLVFVMCCGVLASVAGARSVVSTAKASTGDVQILVTTKQSSTAAIPIAARAGDEFVVTLPSNATTGYKWQLSGKPNSKVVTLVKSVYNAPAQAMPGKGGTEAWTFKAVGKGSTSFTLAYVRPWEKGVAPVNLQSFDVSVK